MKASEQVLASLENGEWQTFDDLKRSCALPEGQITTVLNFLSKFDFLQRNDHQKFRLAPEVVNLFRLVEETGH
jgi:DNA-binding IclR family transcriptional regulator